MLVKDNALLTLQDVSLKTNGTWRLQNLSFSLQKGEVLAIIGPSGAGKSSLIKGLLGLIEGQWLGQFFWQGKALSIDSLQTLRGKKVAWVPQGQADTLNPQRKVIDQVIEVMAKHKLGRWGKRQALAKKLLLEGYLPDYLHQCYPRHLSGGEVQRLLMLLASIHKPSLLLLDEPTAALDSVMREQMLASLKAKQQHSALLLVTHDLELVRRLATKVAVLDAGKLSACQPVADFFEQPISLTGQALLAAEKVQKPITNNPDLSLLKVKDLTYQVGSRQLFTGFNLCLHRKQRLVIEGPSGSGKSTLARLLAGWLPLQKGSLAWQSSTTAGQLAALVPQQAYTACAAHFTVEKIIAEPLLLQKRYKNTEQLKPYLAAVQLPTTDEFLQRLPHQVSGGELQRVILARALSLTPQLLILDEPTSALDPIAKQRWIKLMLTLQQQLGFALLVFTHDQQLSLALGAERMNYPPL